MPFGTTGIVPGRVDLAFVFQAVNHAASIDHTAAVAWATAPPAGLYILSGYGATRATLNTTKIVTVAWTDRQGSTARTLTMTLPTATTSAAAMINSPIYIASGNVTYSVASTGAGATGNYDLEFRLIAI